MKDFFPIHNKPAARNFKKGDVLVLFGELFNRGYANGLVEEAEKNGLKVIRATVGRRDANGELRALTAEETENIPKPFINVPLEAGFDLEKDASGKSPNEYLSGVKLSEWQNAGIPEESLQFSQAAGRKRFAKNTQKFLVEVEEHLTPGCHVHFAHLMAGGVPRCKIVMPLMNRVFKGIGDRFLDSKTFWESGIGRLLQLNFHEVTAETFNILLQESTPLRERIISQGGSVSYVAYGYHGTEIMVQNHYAWQSYAPYIQGWAKVALENYSKAWSDKGVKTCVYNCPEILTNSSSIFQGVEIPLYNLIRAFEKEAPQHPITQKMKTDCKIALKDDVQMNQVFEIVDQFLTSPTFLKTSVYENWPQHSQKDQLALSLETSDKIIALHKDEKSLMTGTLSELVFKACGYIMLHEAYQPKNPVAWIGHEAVVKSLI
ncbi:MAG: enoyl ACP reductase FabMG family protein [Pseudobdellovibrio sp.]